MKRFPACPLLAVAAVGLVALLAAGCGSSDDLAPGAKKMSFALTDAGCDPHNAKAPAGPITFEVENTGSASVTELEVLDGDTILGELENLSEGLSGSFSLTLEEGEYTLRCNGGSNEDGVLTVTSGATATTSPEVEAAVAQYRIPREEHR
jgi:iron uptake system component EfeO